MAQSSSQEHEHTEKAVSRTRSAFIWAKILETPLWAMYNMLPFILHKDLHATPWQLMILFTLRPVLSLLSVYWSSAINRQRNRLLPNVIWGRILGVLTFLLFPFIDDTWFFVCCSGFYLMFARGIVPGWMEILKINLPGFSGKRIFAYTSLFGYIGGGIFSLLFGWLMDTHFQAWRWIFPITALISLIAVFFKLRIPIPQEESTEGQMHSAPPPVQSLSLWERLMQPWNGAWHLLRERADFRYFQIGLMISGIGLMIMQPALPIFIDDVLQLSYTKLNMAISLCKGLGFALTSSLWAHWMHRTNIYRFNAGVIALGCLFSLLVFGAQFYALSIYLAFFCYGVMQSGFEMSWNLSGPLFSKKEESSLFSTVNVMTIGMRGCIAPPLGGILCAWTGSPTVMLLGCLIFSLAYLQMMYSSSQAKEAHSS